MNAEQGLSPTRKKTKSIVSSPSPLFYTKSHLKLTQAYALTASSSGAQVVLYHELPRDVTSASNKRKVEYRPREESESIDCFFPLRAEPFADRQSAPITLTTLPKQTRHATNRLRFVHFQFNRRRGYVSFPVVGFLHEENDFTQYLKIYLDISCR
ncbi:hypothetical protein ALC57_17936 [Trachymyrmex cornetzi]|uniref:Uncharacterized protein n=1 Tax=Trachymyrmex cornetzi TaxID=471704 RepID=A0A195DBZ5_9HYME|nr:hypothetical protein ALC57_17936 [Trachymyrmex cornetzi]